MDAGQNKNQRMEFRRIGGSYQQVIRTAADLRLLLSLDEAHWALNSVSVDSVRSDEQFLAFLDDDMNRQIRLVSRHDERFFRFRGGKRCA